MLFGRKKNHYDASLKLLAEKGYTDEYISVLRGELETSSGAAEKADGMCRLANGLLFCGDLKDAADVFAETDIRKVPKENRQSFAANYILCLFLLNRFKDADRVYEEYNSYVLSEKNIFLRRTVGIHEFTAGRFDSAVTVFIKIVTDDDVRDERGTLMIDICTARAMLKLDMTDAAADIVKDFARYDGRKELTALCLKLRKKVFDASAPDRKVKMVKERGTLKKKKK